MADTNMEAEMARLDERLKSIERMVQTISDAQKEASEGRRRGYEAQERTEREIIGITHRITSLEDNIRAIRPTTVELERVRDRVIFAGSLGRTLWAIGKGLIAAAAGAAAAYYSLTGRTPP